jgi:hypothetical protein
MLPGVGRALDPLGDPLTAVNRSGSTASSAGSPRLLTGEFGPDCRLAPPGGSLNAGPTTPDHRSSSLLFRRPRPKPKRAMRNRRRCECISRFREMSKGSSEQSRYHDRGAVRVPLRAVEGT